MNFISHYEVIYMLWPRGRLQKQLTTTLQTFYCFFYITVIRKSEFFDNCPLMINGLENINLEKREIKIK